MSARVSGGWQPFLGGFSDLVGASLGTLEPPQQGEGVSEEFRDFGQLELKSLEI